MAIGKTLIEFVKEQENAPLAAGDMDAIRHSSPEGGTDTVAFGHKLTPEEDKSGIVYGYAVDSVSLADADDILRRDLHRHEDTLRSRLYSRLGVEYIRLSPRKRMMLLDYEFNLGDVVKKFPSFTRAVVTNDRQAQEKEYVRYYTDATGTRRRLARNKAFYNTFMSDEAVAAIGE